MACSTARVLRASQHGRLEADDPGIIGAGGQVVFAELVGDERAKIAGGADVDAAQGDALRSRSRIELEDVAEGDVLFLQRVLEPLDGLIGFGVDGVVDLNLKDQMGSAAQVKAEMDILLNAGDEAMALMA